MATGTLASPAPSSATAWQFNTAAATWDAEHGPASVRAAEFRARIGYLRALCRSVGCPRVLDLGCATGQSLLHLDDLIACGLGIDIAPRYDRQGQAKCWHELSALSR